MRHLALALAATAAFVAAIPAEAQTRRAARGPIVIEVGPRGWLTPPPNVPAYSMHGTMPALAYRMTFIDRPSGYWHARDRFGEGSLPDFLGSR